MKKRLIENSLIYSGLQVLQGGIGFLMLPFYAHFFTPGDYGIVTVITTVAAFLGVFYLMGLDRAAYLYYFELKDNPEELKRFYGTIITFLLIFALVFTLFLSFFGRSILLPFMGNVKYYPYMYFGIIGAVFLPLFTMYQALQQAQHGGREYGIYKLLNVSALAFLTIVFVFILRNSAIGPLLAIALTSVLFFTFTLWKMRGKFVFGINVGYLKKSLSYSLPIVPHTLAGWTVNLLDRLFINRFVSTAAVGIYNIGFLFGSIQGVVTCAVHQAYTPWFFEEMRKNRTAKVKKFFVLAMTLYITLALWVSVFAKEALWVMVRGDFRESWKVVGLLSFGNFFGGYFYFFVNQLFFTKKGTRYVPVATVSAALLGIGLNLILIKKYGMMGAAVTMFFTNMLTTFITGLFAQVIQPVDWDHLLVVKLVLINGVACMLAYWISCLFSMSLGIVLIIKILIILTCTFINYRLCAARVGGLCSWDKLSELIRTRHLPES